MVFSNNTKALQMQSSLREQVRDHITEYSDNVKKYFTSLSAVAENVTLDKTNIPEYIIKQLASTDEKLQKAIERNKLRMPPQSTHGYL